jgi:hypothetical protein
MNSQVENPYIDQALAQIKENLRLSKEAENEILAEIRSHLEEIEAQSAVQGIDPQEAVKEAIQRFGLEEIGSELQEVHTGWESIEAIVGTALPILFAIILRWLVFTPEGTYLDWTRLFSQPVFWLIAGAALIAPFILFRRWRFALVSWGIFWLITVIFVVFPAVNRW